MSRAITQEELFQEILIKHTTGDETSAEFRRICDEHGLFDDDAGLRRANDAYKERKINALARKGNWIGKDGQPTELVHIIRTKRRGKRSQKTHHRVQLHLCGFSDLAWLVRDRLKRRDYFHDEARKYRDFGVDKYGRKFQKLFPFD